MSMGKVYVYHHNDHDGIVAAGILYKYYLKKQNYSIDDIVFNMVDYTMDLNFDHIDLEYDIVFFLDYSFSNENNRREFESLLKRRTVDSDVTWIDHHKSSIGLFNDYNIYGIRDISLCGAAWTYLWAKGVALQFINTTKEYSKTFHESTDIPLYLKYIDDYDCWKGLYKMTNDFHYGLNVSSPWDGNMKSLLKDDHDFIAKICTTGEAIQNYLNFENKEYHVDMYGFEYTLPEEHGGYKCFCMNRKGNSLMFGDKVNEYDAVIPFYYNNGKWTYSMFTIKDNVDCEATARSYGGGGHLKAAGWSIDRFIFND